MSIVLAPAEQTVIREALASMIRAHSLGCEMLEERAELHRCACPLARAYRSLVHVFPEHGGAA